MTSGKNTLFLLPNLLGELPQHEDFLPRSIDKVVESLDGIIAESEKGGRRYLKRFKTLKPAHNIPLALLNEHTKKEDYDFLLEPILKGEKWGLVSDAGLPCIADPGSDFVLRARQRGIAIQAFVGPSSVTLGLMLSGLPGQRFAFHGYLNREKMQRKREMKNWEMRSKTDQETQIFIEAPYRNSEVLKELLETLQGSTLLCLAWDLTLPTQNVMTQTVDIWKKSPLPNVEKKPLLFLFYHN